MRDEVVGAHGDEIDPDRAVPAGFGRDRELGAHAVGGGDEDRVQVTRRPEVEQTAETADAPFRSRPSRALRQRPNALDDLRADIDVDASVPVTGPVNLAGPAW